MRRSRLRLFILGLVAPLLSGCVDVNAELNKIVNSKWNEWFSARIDPSVIASAAGACLSFLALLVGVIAIWGIIQWARSGDTWAFGLFLVLMIIALAPLALNIIAGFSDWLAPDGYSITYIFHNMGWEWPPSGDINPASLTTAVGLTVFLPLLSLLWEVFIVLPFLTSMVVTAAVSRSKGPLWLGGTVLLGWMLVRPVHYVIVTIIGVNKPDGVVGALVGTGMTLNNWYFGGTLGMLAVLWIFLPGAVSVFLLVSSVRSKRHGNQNGGRKGRGGSLIAGVPTDGDGEGEGNGSGKPKEPDNLNGATTKDKNVERNQSTGNKNHESAGDGNLEKARTGTRKTQDSKRTGEHAEESNLSSATTKGQYVRVTRGKAAKHESGGRTFIGWKNPDTGGVDYFPEGVDPNNLSGGSTNLEEARSTDRNSSVPVRKQADEGDDQDKNSLTGSDQQISTGTYEANTLVSDGQSGTSHQPVQPTASEEADGTHNLQSAMHPAEPEYEGSTSGDVETGGGDPNSLTEANQQITALHTQAPASSEESQHGHSLTESADSAAIIAGDPVAGPVLAAKHVLDESGWSERDPARNTLIAVVDRGNKEMRRHNGGGEETDLSQHSL